MSCSLRLPLAEIEAFNILMPGFQVVSLKTERWNLLSDIRTQTSPRARVVYRAREVVRHQPGEFVSLWIVMFGREMNI
jgi:hypothetical protein